MTRSSGVGIGGGRIRPQRAARLLDESKDLAGRKGIEILIMDADMIFGRVHIESAVEHAFRAFERGKNVAVTRMMEVMLYASGERQLSAAIKKMGVGSGTVRVAVVVLDGSKLSDVMRDLEVKQDDGVLDGDPDRLSAFGISRKALESVGPEKAIDLVLEKVAAVDTLK